MKKAIVTTAFAATAFLAGCLPRGQAPAGRRWLPSRTVEQVLFAPGPDGEPARLLTTRRSAATGFAQVRDVYAVSPPASAETFGAESLLLDQIGNAGQTCIEPSCKIPTDSRGRILLPRETRPPGGGPETFSLVRVDPLTGDKTDLGPETYYVGLSPDRRTFAYQRGGTLVLRELDDQEVRVEQGYSASFVGGNVYVQTEGTLAWLRPPYDTRQELAHDIDNITLIQGRETLVALCRRGPGVRACESSLLDPVTGVETPLPAEVTQPFNLKMSPSGRYLFGFATLPSDDGSYALWLYDRQTATLRSTTGDGLWGEGVWRPGHDEIWFTTEASSPNQDSPADPATQTPPQRSSWRWRPGDAPMKVGDTPFFVPFGPFIGNAASSWPFTPDGRFWVSYAANSFVGDKPAILLRAVDDASAAPLLLNPAGTAVQNLWPIGDGRLVVEDRISNEKRSDIYLVDPAARTMRQLGHSGNVVATGSTRILVFLDWLIGGGSGELTLIDLATDARTLLAENVHDVVVEKAAAGADALAPGTRVVYVSRHRIESPYDGLWVARLP